jgi:anti-sigma regulatory factor (Ser/Thr protein kinase)
LLRELSLHILDIAENSVEANAKNIEVSVEENTVSDRLRIVIKDNGKGMNPESVAHVTNPFFTSRTTRRVGLGIPFLKEAAESCNGYLKIESAEGIGTTMEVEFQRSHIDRMPIGDLENTFLNLLVGYPHVHWIFRYKMDTKQFILDDGLIKRELVDIPLSDPTVLSYLRKVISDRMNEIRIVNQ